MRYCNQAQAAVIVFGFWGSYRLILGFIFVGPFSWLDFQYQWPDQKHGSQVPFHFNQTQGIVNDSTPSSQISSPSSTASVMEDENDESQGATADTEEDAGLEVDRDDMSSEEKDNLPEGVYYSPKKRAYVVAAKRSGAEPEADSRKRVCFPVRSKTLETQDDCTPRHYAKRFATHYARTGEDVMPRTKKSMSGTL